FSSRRRHTRSYGDWSSDVCSSDLLWSSRRRHHFPNCCAWYSTLLLPAVAVPMTAIFPETPPVERAKLAIPLTSDCTVAFDSARRSEERRVGKERRILGVAISRRKN